MMGRGGPFYNRPFNPNGPPRGMRGMYRGPRGFNPIWRGRGRGGPMNHQMPPNYYDDDDEYTRCV